MPACRPQHHPHCMCASHDTHTQPASTCRYTPCYNTSTVYLPVNVCASASLLTQTSTHGSTSLGMPPSPLVLRICARRYCSAAVQQAAPCESVVLSLPPREFFARHRLGACSQASGGLRYLHMPHHSCQSSRHATDIAIAPWTLARANLVLHSKPRPAYQTSGSFSGPYTCRHANECAAHGMR